MATLLELAVNKYSESYYDWGGPAEGSGPYDGTKDIDSDMKLDIDCSHLVNNVLNDAGYNIPYLPTNKLNSDEVLKYFDLISLDEATEDDLILFPKHVGIFSKFDPRTKTGQYFGSQSKGPSLAKFDEKGTWGWKMNFKLLRPKKIFLSQNNLSSSATVQQVKRYSNVQDNSMNLGRWRLEADSNHIGFIQRDSLIRWLR